MDISQTANDNILAYDTEEDRNWQKKIINGGEPDDLVEKEKEIFTVPAVSDIRTHWSALSDFLFLNESSEYTKHEIRHSFKILDEIVNEYSAKRARTTTITECVGKKCGAN